MGTIPGTANVHAGSQSDVFEGGERLNFALVVIIPGGFSHIRVREYQGKHRSCQLELRFVAIPFANNVMLHAGTISRRKSPECQQKTVAKMLNGEVKC